MSNVTSKKNTTARNIVIAGAGAAIAAMGVVSAPAPAHAASESTWDSLAHCESGGNWGTNTGNGFSGGLQFTPSTWSAFGGSGSPQGASKAEQIRVAENVLAGQGWGAWPACSASLGLHGNGGGAAVAPVKAAPAPQAQSVAPESSVQAAPATSTPAPAQASAPATNTPADTGIVSQAPVTPQTQVAPAQGQNTYTVQKGDTLSLIAQAFGIPGGWQTLFSLNQDVLHDPNIIEIGTVLHLS